MYQPVYLGMDENGNAVSVELPERHLLDGGEPGGGKSVLLNNIVGHAALCTDVKLLFDGKQVELGMAPRRRRVRRQRPHRGQPAPGELQAEMDRRYDQLVATDRRNVLHDRSAELILCVVDEIAYYSATAGDKKTQETFTVLLRDLVARGRAAGIIVVAATQRPSADIIPTSLRDLFGYRCAFRCTTDISSDIILGYGWAKNGYTAASIAPEDRGVGYLLAEGGIPVRFKAAYLTDQQIKTLVGYALDIRGPGAPHDHPARHSRLQPAPTADSAPRTTRSSPRSASSPPPATCSTSASGS